MQSSSFAYEGAFEDVTQDLAGIANDLQWASPFASGVSLLIVTW